MRLLMVISIGVFLTGAATGTSYAQPTIDEYMQMVCASNKPVCTMGEDIAAKMMGCLTLPEGAPKNYEMLAQIMLKDGDPILVKIDMTTLPGSWEAKAVPIISDAITDCGPYGTQSGPALFVLNPALFGSSPKL